MAEVAVREHAHDGRVSQLLKENHCLYSCGADGRIRRWTHGKLDMLAEVSAAHGGEKVHCLAMGRNGVLYSGGDDQLIRAWCPNTLAPIAGFEPVRVRNTRDEVEHPCTCVMETV
jgi:hypothetical protein